MEDERRGRYATLKDVARLVGVSHTTVSNAFSQPDRLSVDLRTRILTAARELGYAGPNPAAQSLRRGRADAVGLVLSHDFPFALSDPAALGVLRGVGMAYRDQHINLLLIASHDKEAGVARAIIPNHAAVDGMILYSLAHNSGAVARAARRHIPIVVIDQPRLEGAGFVWVDSRAAVMRAAERGHALGHRRVAILSLKLCADSRTGLVDAGRRAAAHYPMVMERIGAWHDALARVGLDIDDVPIWECGEALETDACRGAAVLLAQERRPTLLIALSDRLALGAIRAARELGLSVPRDLSVIGFDDIPEACQLGLATIWQPHEAKGEEAARLLGEENSQREVTLEATFVERESLGEVPAQA